MKNLKFKLVPFIISLAIVIGSVVGISAYSYHEYDNNKLRFVADYFHYEDYKDVQTEQQIEEFVRMTSSHYAKVNQGLKYLDVNSGNEYNEKESSSSKNLINGATFQNGVLHIPDAFDLVMYAETSWNTDSEKWVFTYYIYIYNVNYKAEGLIDRLYFTFVDANGNTTIANVIEKVKDGEYGGPNGTNLPVYTYNGKVSSSTPMHIHDNNAKGKGVESDKVPYVYRLTTMSEAVFKDEATGEMPKSRWFYEVPESNFSIFYSGSDNLSDAIANGTTNEVEEIVRGSYTQQYKDAKEFNSKANDGIVFEGFGKDVYKAGYFKFIFWRLFVTALITFVISGVLAVLFYLIWQDDNDEKPIARVKAPKPKKR